MIWKEARAVKGKEIQAYRTVSICSFCVSVRLIQLTSTFFFFIYIRENSMENEFENLSISWIEIIYPSKEVVNGYEKKALCNHLNLLLDTWKRTKNFFVPNLSRRWKNRLIHSLELMEKCVHVLFSENGSAGGCLPFYELKTYSTETSNA